MDSAPSAYALIIGCTGVLGQRVSLPKRSSTRVALAGRGQASRPVTQAEQGRGPSEPGTSGVPAMDWAANACMNHIKFERIQAASKLCSQVRQLQAPCSNSAPPGAEAASLLLGAGLSSRQSTVHHLCPLRAPPGSPAWLPCNQA